MTKINRRDYLKRMGAAGSAIAGAKLSTLAQSSKRDKKTQPRREPIVRTSLKGILNWPITNTPPSLTSVTAIFSGLMGFSYDQASQECKVGFHPGDGHHELDVKIYQYRKYPDCSQIFPPPPLPKRIKKITLKVLDQSGNPTGKPVDFFETKDEPFDRFSGNANDFRWLPDLDSADFYPEGYSKNSGHFSATLHVKNGTFYTYLRSNSTFKLVDADDASHELRRFGHLARYMAAAIDVKDNNYLSLQINDETPFKLEPAAGYYYQILFTNECWDNGKKCDWLIWDDDETKRNDFHFTRKVLRLPNSRIKYALKIEDKLPRTDPEICGYAPDRNTDEAPCMGSGYGQDNL